MYIRWKRNTYNKDEIFIHTIIILIFVEVCSNSFYGLLIFRSSRNIFHSLAGDNILQFQIILRGMLITILNFFNIDLLLKIDVVDMLEYANDYSGYVP